MEYDCQKLLVFFHPSQYNGQWLACNQNTSTWLYKAAAYSILHTHTYLHLSQIIPNTRETERDREMERATAARAFTDRSSECRRWYCHSSANGDQVSLSLSHRSKSVSGPGRGFSKERDIYGVKEGGTACGGGLGGRVLGMSVRV